MSTVSCPCQSGDLFSRCCEPYLSGTALAPTAEALMRSRFSAFCTGNAEYLVDTHHPAHRSAEERDHIARHIRSVEWLHLTVLAMQKGGEDDTSGEVTFCAAYRAKPAPLSTETAEITQLHERSRFVREGGRWFYTEGDQLTPYQPGRNERCWCGSGRKTKQCHG